MIRLGLCCLFAEEPISFRTTTATSLKKLSRADAFVKLSSLCLHNARSLQVALRYCAANGIGCFRVNSQILPVKTHPQVGYDIKELPEGKLIISEFRACKTIADEFGLRTSFHPDQFILLSSPSEEVTQRSFADLNYQAEVAEWIGADVINIHGGGAYGDKTSALARVRQNIKRLSKSVKERLTLENDDKTYTPHDLLPLCLEHRLGFVYDVHHHRCLPDGVSVEETTKFALKTWSREPMFHLSSPKDGWKGAEPNRHHDYINIKDFPAFWRKLKITIEVEAKAKELAVIKLKNQLDG